MPLVLDIAAFMFSRRQINNAKPWSMLVADLQMHPIINAVDLAELAATRSAADRKKAVAIGIQAHDISIFNARVETVSITPDHDRNINFAARLGLY